MAMTKLGNGKFAIDKPSIIIDNWQNLIAYSGYSA
jgi:hypothetical protein